MTLTVQREELAALEPEWRELLPRCVLRNVFVSPTWLNAWWQEFGGDRELMLLSVRRDSTLEAVVPLMRDGERLTFAGDSAVCDYMDLISPPRQEAEVLTALFRSLGEEPWQELTLWAVREDSPTLAALAAVCSVLGLTLEVEFEDVCPQIELPGSWDQHLAAMGKKDRHELRRKLRRLSQGGDVELENLKDGRELEAALDDFLLMHAASRAERPPS